MTQSEFDARRETGELALTLVGMSNVGKSHWSQVLPGFEHYNCDDAIETGLESVMRGQGFKGGIHDVAAWMGQPYEERYPETSKAYLELEEQYVQTVLRHLEQGQVRDSLVIDTTGSVVHLHPGIRNRLQAATTVVCLDTSQRLVNELFDLYVSNPKPVIWGESYKVRSGETSEEALIRCFPELLDFRTKLYKGMAHVVIPREVALDTRTGEEFLAYVRDGLPK